MDIVAYTFSFLAEARFSASRLVCNTKIETKQSNQQGGFRAMIPCSVEKKRTNNKKKSIFSKRNIFEIFKNIFWNLVSTAVMQHCTNFNIYAAEIIKI